MVKYKVYVKNNYFYLEKINPVEIFSSLSKNVEINPNNIGKTSYRIYNLRDWNSATIITLPQLFKEDGSPYTQNEWETFYTENTGNFNSGAVLAPQISDALNNANSPSGSNPFITANDLIEYTNYIYVDNVDKLPTPIGNIYYLEDNTAYHFTKTVDLEGKRIICGENSVILGSSSENSYLLSTGLVGLPLITSEYSLPMRNITITADIALDLNGDSVTTALDWLGVNFTNCETIGTIQNYTNHVWTDCAFLESGNLTYDGTIGSVAISSSLFNTAPGQKAFIISPTCVITRRFRAIFSAFIINTGETGIDFSTIATVPVEGYILRVCNFSGGGTYTSGVLFNDNKAQFKDNVGVPNSNEICLYSMNGNLIPTIITGSNSPVKVAGNTVNSAISQRFTHTNNRATYIGAITRVFEVKVTLTLTSGNNHQIGAYIAKNGVEINDSEMYVTTNGSGRAENVYLQTLVSLEPMQYLEVFSENNNIPFSNITVSDLNVIIR